jgi:hypothetical protein
MKIILDELFYIEIDSNLNHTLYKIMTTKSGKNIGKETPFAYGYYSSIASAVKSYIKHSLADEETTLTLKEYIERYEQKTEEIKKLIGC